MEKYDIFISYRRSSYDTANLVATRLKAIGYSVFFDVETLRSGKFNEQLYEVIDNCKDFVIILPPKALDRCVNEDDWVRLEVCRAMKNNKNIIPIMLNGFTWPNPMPIGMEDLSNYQALTASSIEYFDLAMERLQQRFLKSKKYIPIKQIMKYVYFSVFSLLMLLTIVWGVFMMLSRDVCVKYATAIVKDASYIHMLAEESQKLKKDWDIFNNTLNYERYPENIAYLQESMLNRIDLTEKDIKRLWNVDSTKLNITPYHSFLLSMHGINAEEIAMSPMTVSLFYNDFLEQLNRMKVSVQEPTIMNRRFISVLFDVSTHSINSFYACLLSALSSFPENSQSTFKELSPYWIYFPKQYKEGEDKSYYEDIMSAENGLANEVMSNFGSILEHQDAELEEVLRKNEEVLRKYNELEK